MWFSLLEDVIRLAAETTLFITGHLALVILMMQFPFLYAAETSNTFSKASCIPTRKIAGVFIWNLEGLRNM